MRIIPRSEWGARYLPVWGKAPQPAAELWLHHSATIAPDLVPPFDDDDAAVRTLERIGQERFGGGISYTFAVTPAGRVYEGHPMALLGSHTGGRNGVARAICLVGNYDRTRPPEPMLAAVVELIRHGHAAGWWTTRTLSGGHRDVRSTDCPGDTAYALIPEINRRALGRPAPATQTPAAPRPAPLPEAVMSAQLVIVTAPGQPWIGYTPATGGARHIGPGEGGVVRKVAGEAARIVELTAAEYAEFREFLARPALADTDRAS